MARSRLVAHPDETGCPRHLDEAHARYVAAQFIAAVNAPGNLKVAAAYQELELQTDKLFASLTRGPSGVRVVFTRCGNPYLSDAEMIAAVRATRVLEVATAAIDSDRRHPALGNELGGAYDRFRAVHDLIGHVRPRYGFDRHGEYAAWIAQDHAYSGIARRALATELHAEHSVLWTTGVLAQHKATLMPRDMFRRARAGLGPRGRSMQLQRSAVHG
jgi:hypothetical protein